MEPTTFLSGASVCHGNMLFLGNTDALFHNARSVVGLEGSSKRRSFRSSPEDIFGDEYYDEQSPEKKRRLSSEQVHFLEKTFEAENKLDPERKTELAMKLGLQPRQVAVWFQNRRARWKTEQLERDYDQLKTSYDALRMDYESILKVNDKLRAEVASLNEKLQSREAVTESHFTCRRHGIELAMETQTKEDDGFSSGSRGSSTLVEEEHLQLLDSSCSYLFGDVQHVDLIDPIKLEEYDSSGDDGSYFCDVFGEQQVSLGLWAWP